MGNSTENLWIWRSCGGLCGAAEVVAVFGSAGAVAAELGVCWSGYGRFGGIALSLGGEVGAEDTRLVMDEVLLVDGRGTHAEAGRYAAVTGGQAHTDTDTSTNTHSTQHRYRERERERKARQVLRHRQRQRDRPCFAVLELTAPLRTVCAAGLAGELGR